jgi:hypothetical protein
MTKKIIIFTTPRTGSTYYCKHLEQTHNILNLQEFFSPFYEDYENNTLSRLGGIQNWVLKIFPSHISNFPENFVEELLKLSTDHIFLYRKNFKDQVKSWVLSLNTQQFMNNRSNLVVTASDQQILDARNILYDEYLFIKKIYKKFSGKIVAYEDFATSDQKYLDYRSTEGNFDIIEDFDVYNEVFG